jgi:hypothetical protein
VRFVANGRSRSLTPIAVNTAVVSDGRVAPDETPEGLIGGNKRMQRAVDRPMRTRRLVYDPLASPPLVSFATLPLPRRPERTRGRVLSRGAVTRDANERNDLDQGAFARPGARNARARVRKVLQGRILRDQSGESCSRHCSRSCRERKREYKAPS